MKKILLFAAFVIFLTNIANGQYILTDSDVTISGGIITDCSYDYSNTEIIIPETLNGQTVTEIGTNAFYSDPITAITLPSTLQVINSNAFYNCNIATVDFSTCTALHTIGGYAFYSNNISSVDLSTCTALSLIDRCFPENPMTQFALPVITGKEDLGWRDDDGNVFEGGDIVPNGTITYRLPHVLTDDQVVVTDGIIESVSYDRSSIKDIIIPDTLDGQEVIGIASHYRGIFYYKYMKTLVLPTTIEFIGDNAFATNYLAYTNIAECSNLIHIGERAFAYSGLTELTLPVVSSYETYGWKDFNGNTYTGGDAVTDFETQYWVPVPYTLTDSDVVVTDGIIESCSYNFSFTDIIIPETLDGQTVTGINPLPGSDGVFYNKGITSVQLPVTIERIGYESFYGNYITNIDLSRCASLTYIGEYAFYDNKLTSLDLTGCTALDTIVYGAFSDNQLTSLNIAGLSNLEYIGDNSFEANLLTSVDFTGCTSLTTIGEEAFLSNEITNLVFNGCNSLEFIGADAFYDNTSLPQVDLSQCTKLRYIGDEAFRYTSISSITLPINESYPQLGWMDENANTYNGGDVITNLSTFYRVPIPYTLTDNDVEMINGIIQSCSYDFEFTDIIIPEILDGQTVTGIKDTSYYYRGVFYGQGITSVKLPNTLETIGDYAFYDNIFNNVDLTTCTQLKTIGKQAFLYSGSINTSHLQELDLTGCTSLTSIGYGAFSSHSITNLDLSGCPALKTIDDYAFSYNGLTNLNLTASTALTTIGKYAFRTGSLTSLDLSACSSLKTIGEYAFAWNSLSEINLSGCTALTSIQVRAFAGNSLSSGFALPTPDYTGFLLDYWIDGTGAQHDGGDVVTNTETYYSAILVPAKTINFHVTDGVTPIKGVSINLDGYGEKLSGTDGNTVFTVMEADSIFYSASATNYFTVTDSVAALDSTVTENVTMISCMDSISLTEIICEGEVVNIGDSTYTETGTFVTNLSNQFGCDSIVTLNLTVNPVHSTEQAETICEGEVVNVGDSTYSETGIFVTDLSNQYGCDSIVTLNLTVLPKMVYIEKTVCEGETVAVGDSLYNETGIYIDTLTNQLGCDSIVTLTLTVTTVFENTIEHTMCAGENYVWQGRNYTISGIYSDSLVSQYGCDSIVTLNLTVNPVDSTELTETICAGEVVTIGDSIYTQTGEFTTIFTNQYGCDSTVILDLTVNPVDSVELTETICAGEAVSVGDSTYSGTGFFVTNLTNQYGCDSIITLNLTVNPVDSIELTEIVCEGDVIDVGDSTYSETGIFVTNLTNQYGCDSIVTLNLTVTPVHSFELTETICEGEQVDIGDSTYTETGIFITPMKNQYGCDSIVALDLTVLPLQTIIDNEICEGETIVFGNSTYSSTGTYKDTLSNQLGCDSIVTLNLTVNPVYFIELTEIICEGESVDIGGIAYTETGIFVTTLANQYGCDSIVTLNLTVNPVDAVTLNKTICEGKTYSMGGKSYSATGKYVATLTNHNGCDSVVTLNLTVNPVDAVTLNETICEGEIYPMGGESYSATGEYTTTLTNRSGCDSVVTLNLTVNPVDAVVIYDTIYQGESYLFNGIDYTEAGSYEANLVNQSGCDSVVALILAVSLNESPQVLTKLNDLEMRAGDTLAMSIDLAGGIFYDPDNPTLVYNFDFTGETPAEWTDFTINNGLFEINATPTAADTGCYEITVTATDPQGQMAGDTFSLCVIRNYTGTDDFMDNGLNVTMYPNPTEGKVTLDFSRPVSEEIEIRVVSLTGRQVFRQIFYGPSKQISFDLTKKTSGVYLIVLQTKNRQITKELIIK